MSIGTHGGTVIRITAWMTIGLFGGVTHASAAPDAGPAISSPRTIEFPASPPAPDVEAAAQPATTVAQSQINAGPLQGPLSASIATGQSARCSCPIHHVVHHRRMLRRASPTLSAALPVVPAYAYPPVIVYRPVPLFYGVRPFYPPYVHPYVYRPFFYGPHPYGRGFY